MVIPFGTPSGGCIPKVECKFRMVGVGNGRFLRSPTLINIQGLSFLTTLGPVSEIQVLNPGECSLLQVWPSINIHILLWRWVGGTIDVDWGKSVPTRSPIRTTLVGVMPTSVLIGVVRIRGTPFTFCSDQSGRYRSVLGINTIPLDIPC